MALIFVSPARDFKFGEKSGPGARHTPPSGV
jgi:hypothetical protein